MTERNRGTFTGDNLKEQKALERELTPEEGREWEADEAGEEESERGRACRAMALFTTGPDALGPQELHTVAGLLAAVDGDREDTLLRLQVLVHVQGADLGTVTVADLQDLPLNTYRGSSFIEVRREAAFELFQLCWPDLYAVWEKTPMDGLRFDVDAFLDSPAWVTEELQLGSDCVLLVLPYG
jgi:hypothetical protein